MTYRYRPLEPGPRLPVAPYVMREDIDPHPREWTDEQRAAVRVPFNPERCGDYAGWMHHRRTNTPACEPCHAAYLKKQSEYGAKAYAKKKQANAKAK